MMCIKIRTQDLKKLAILVTIFCLIFMILVYRSQSNESRRQAAKQSFLDLVFHNLANRTPESIDQFKSKITRTRFDVNCKQIFNRDQVLRDLKKILSKN